ncbi:hypothetical protein Dimus_020389 [Dionaea muscipula]
MFETEFPWPVWLVGSQEFFFHLGNHSFHLNSKKHGPISSPLYNSVSQFGYGNKCYLSIHETSSPIQDQVYQGSNSPTKSDPPSPLIPDASTKGNPSPWDSPLNHIRRSSQPASQHIPKWQNYTMQHRREK